MLEIKENTIYLTRGDKATIRFSIENYKFNVNDNIKFKIYKACELNQKAILIKEILVKKECDYIDITLSSEETKIGNLQNSPITLWYEIKLNDEQTVIGYDENGAKKIILYPEGADEKCLN